MKKLLIVAMILASGCGLLSTEHHAKFSGVHNGRSMYEMQCNDALDCRHDAIRVCGGRKWDVVYEWFFDRGHHYMLECWN